MFLINVASILLVFMTAISYVPQYRRMLALRSSAGLSVPGVLLNVIVAQAQVANMWLLCGFAPAMDYDVPVATPLILRDWVNLTQLLVQWACSLVLFALVCKMPSSSHALPPGRLASSGDDFWLKQVALIIWIAHAFTIFLLIPALTYGAFGFMYIMFGLDMAGLCFFNFLVTLLAVASFIFQLSETSAADDIGALSKSAIARQIATFLLLAVLWPFRLIIPSGIWEHGPRPALLTQWLPWVGWACVNNAIFAAGQGAMLYTVKGKDEDNGALVGEAQPLFDP